MSCYRILDDEPYRIFLTGGRKEGGMTDTDRKKQNFQEVRIVRKCYPPIDVDESQCIGYKNGSHGNCYFRGTGSAYDECSNPVILGGRIKV